MSSLRHLHSSVRALIILLLLLASLALPCNTRADPPFLLPPKKDLLKIRSAIIYTNQGDLLVKLFPDTAPWHVANFKYLADKGFYNNLKFHLFEEHYIIQGGDPSGTGNGGPGYTLHPEFSDLPHVKGTLGMSRRSDEINSERLSNGSQFHLLLTEAPFMDRKYTIFGQVVGGMDVLDKLDKGDTIRGVKVFLRE